MTRWLCVIILCSTKGLTDADFILHMVCWYIVMVCAGQQYLPYKQLGNRAQYAATTRLALMDWRQVQEVYQNHISQLPAELVLLCKTVNSRVNRCTAWTMKMVNYKCSIIPAAYYASTWTLLIHVCQTITWALGHCSYTRHDQIE